MVNAATSKRTPSTRHSSIAMLLTSITTLSTAPSRITARMAWRSVASGVVRAPWWATPATRTPTVPISPVVRPAARSPDSTIVATVVLPFVPVIPIICSPRAGSP